MKTWELAIEAQGGRQRLIAINNIFISASGMSRANVLWETFYVFPYRQWTWTDYRPSVFGMNMRMYDWETGKKYIVDFHQKTAELQPIDKWERERLTSGAGTVSWAGLVIYLLESRWWKPIPSKMTRESDKGERVDVVQTTVSGKQVDFYLSPKSHLPLKIRFHNLMLFLKLQVLIPCMYPAMPTLLV